MKRINLFTLAPFGLANGAVTAPKLSAAAVPSVGQVLGFNGANLAWQDAPVGGVRVVDSLGQVVGPLVNPSTGPFVLRKVGGFLFGLVRIISFNSLNFYRINSKSYKFRKNTIK